MSSHPALKHFHHTYTLPMPLFSSTCTPFSATKPSQPLSCQSFAHSFPCHGGGIALFCLSAFCLLHFSLQICPFIINNFQDAPPATLFFSCFCIVARGWHTPLQQKHSRRDHTPRREGHDGVGRGRPLYFALRALRKLYHTLSFRAEQADFFFRVRFLRTRRPAESRNLSS